MLNFGGSVILPLVSLQSWWSLPDAGEKLGLLSSHVNARSFRSVSVPVQLQHLATAVMKAGPLSLTLKS